jgi:hypothetical protein
MPGYGATDAAARGLTFGLSDVLGAVGGATGNLLKQYLPPPGGSPAQPGSWPENYQRFLKGEQQAAQQYAADYPVRSPAAGLLGMLSTAAPGAALRWAAPGARGLIAEIARTAGGGALVGTGAAVPQATQEPTWTEAARDVALGAGTGAVGGAAGAAAPSVLRQVVRYPPVVAAKAVPAAIGTAIGEHFFPGAEGLFGAYLGEHTLGSLGQALEPYANKIGTWLQGKVPLDRALGGLPAIPGAALVRWMLPGQPVPPGP